MPTEKIIKGRWQSGWLRGIVDPILTARWFESITAHKKDLYLKEIIWNILMYQIGEIVELKAARMMYTTIGMVINLSPLECQLRGGATYVVKSATVRKLRSELQEQFRPEFTES